MALLFRLAGIKIDCIQRLLAKVHYDRKKLSPQHVIKPIIVLVHEYGICIVNIIHCIVNVLSLNISSDLSQLTHMYIYIAQEHQIHYRYNCVLHWENQTHKLITCEIVINTFSYIMSNKMLAMTRIWKLTCIIFCF